MSSGRIWGLIKSEFLSGSNGVIAKTWARCLINDQLTKEKAYEWMAFFVLKLGKREL